MSLKVLSRVSVLAAVYALLTLLPPLNALGYGPIQVRVAEALTVLPFVFPWAPWGLYLGCILANLGSPFLVWDLSLGAFSSLAAAFLTRRMSHPLLAPLPPVIVNALVVSAYVAPLSGMPYAIVALYIAAGQAVACYGLGYPLLTYILRNQRLREVLGGEQGERGTG
ncbi:MAG: QueT transporter family protein [Bacillota bacterium]|nr:QueT transporter family protein [Candidatus Fermentithermobacillaceae bacterium]